MVIDMDEIKNTFGCILILTGMIIILALLFYALPVVAFIAVLAIMCKCWYKLFNICTPIWRIILVIATVAIIVNYYNNIGAFIGFCAFIYIIYEIAQRSTYHGKNSDYLQ